MANLDRAILAALCKIADSTQSTADGVNTPAPEPAASTPDREIGCFVPNGSPEGTPPEAGVVIYSDDPTQYFIGTTDVTATHTLVPCTAASTDYELKETCYQTVGDPTARFTRVDWFESEDLTTPQTTIWFNVTAGTYSATAPANIEACTEAVEVDGIYTNAQLICVTDAGTSTTWLLRQRETVSNVDGSVISTTTEYTNDGVTWSTTVPTGTITIGQCIVQPVDRHVELGCVFNLLTGAARPINQITTFDADGVPTVTYTESDGTTAIPAFAPGETFIIGDCEEITVTESVEPGCADGVPYTRRRNVFRVGSTGQTLQVVVGYFDSANTETATAPANFRLGPCCCDQVVASGCWEDGTASGQYVTILGSDGELTSTDPATNLTVDSALFVDCDIREPWVVQTQGTTPAVLPFTEDIESVTVTVFAGTVTVDTGNGIVVIPAGSSFSWGQGTEENLKVTEMTFTGSAGSDYTVHGEVNN